VIWDDENTKIDKIKNNILRDIYMEFLIYDYSKDYVGYDNLSKKNMKKERLSYECLYEFFNEEKNKIENKYEYFLTSYKKKSQGLNVKFYLRRRTNNSYDDSHTIEVFNVVYMLDGEEHKYLKKYSKNKVIGINRKEDDDGVVYFYVVVEDQRIKPNTIKLNCECNICYEPNKDTLENGFFKCNHKEICINCHKNLQVKICPICRSI
jgi:hypothetical protein